MAGGKRHREEGKTKQNGGDTEVQENVPTRFFQAIFSLLNGHLLELLIAVFVNIQSTWCIRFLFGHIRPITAEHFKSATRYSLPNGNRR